MEFTSSFIHNVGIVNGTRIPSQRKFLLEGNAALTEGRRHIVFSTSLQTIECWYDASAGKDGTTWLRKGIVQAVGSQCNSPVLGVAQFFIWDLPMCSYRYLSGGRWYLYTKPSVLSGGATWGANIAQPFGASYDISTFGCAADSAGEWGIIVSTYKAGTGYLLQHSRLNGAAIVWSAVVDLPRQWPSTTQVVDYPAIVSFDVGANKCIEVCWQEYNSGGVGYIQNAFSSDNGASWTLCGGFPIVDYVDFDNAYRSFYPSIDVDVPRGLLHLVYIKQDAGGIYQTYYKKKTLLGQDWGNAVIINRAYAATGCRDPVVNVAIDGRIYVTWSQKNRGLSRTGQTQSESLT